MSPIGIGDRIVRADIINNYLKHADELELSHLIDAAQACLKGEPVKLLTTSRLFSKVRYENVFFREALLYRNDADQLEEWNGIGRPPKNLLSNSGSDSRESLISSIDLTGCRPSGFAIITKSDQVLRQLALVGLLVVFYGRPIRDYIEVTGYKKKTLINLLDETKQALQIKVAVEGNQILIEDQGPILSSNPIPYLKIAFPKGVLVWQSKLFHLF
ncbi:hypothetical protein [Vibrio nigripulchritudo]|uniref:hypothetical protein n=1 Tax=Vibrio nigripulchritudo TaxID=28173 RepID=UPI001909BA91|nr:hypothetical protein [Vibrio nigripulchritudo]